MTDMLRTVKQKLLHLLLKSELKRGGEVGTRNLAVREQWLKEALLAIPSGSRLLDAGAGELQYKDLCAHLHYVSQDFAQYDGAGDGAGLQQKAWEQRGLDIVSDIATIPEPDASFDAIMCIEVLEHVPHPVEALKEFARLLKPGGTLLVTAPFCSLTHFSPYFYHNGFSPYFYQHWLPACGFTIEGVQYNGNYFEYLAQEIRRLPEIASRYAAVETTSTEDDAREVILGLLNRLSQTDNGSEELLSFGLHVRARRCLTAVRVGGQ